MKKRQFIFYGWLIVGAGMAAHALGYGARYSFSVILPSLLEEFQWPRDTTAAMLSFHMVVYGFVAPVAGYLVDKIGPRKTMALGTVLLALGLALSENGSQPWHFYLSFGVLCGAGLCLTGSVPFNIVIRNWFERRRGLALSLMYFGAGGAFACYPAIAFLIDSLSWRLTFRVEALVVAGFMLPIIIFVVRYDPQDRGLTSDGTLEVGSTSPNKGEEVPQSTNHARVAIDWTLSRAAKTSRFWLLCLSTFSVWGIAEHILVTHHVAFATDLGYSKVYAASVLSLFGVLFGFGALAGFLSDRIGREVTMTVASSIGISGIVLLTLMRGTSMPWMLYYYAIAMGFGLGMTAPTIAASAIDIFQGPRVGAIIGAIWFSFAIGGSIGPWLGGWIFELCNDYTVAFIVGMVLYAVGCGAIWWAAPRKVRQATGRVRLFGGGSNI